MVAEIFVVIFVWILPAGAAAGFLALIIEALKLLGAGPWWVWLILSPALYIIWLVSYLTLSGILARSMAKKYPKPRRAVLPDQRRQLRGVASSLIRKAIIEGLPLYSFAKGLPQAGQLIVFGYSPSLKVGKHVSLGPPAQLVDPDLTEIGDHAVLGAGAAIAAHFGKSLPDGRLVYITAPVKIGAGATVGAYSIVSLGCEVGDASIIEPLSYLPPYTQVPAYEVWGGRPAVFLRKIPRKDGTGTAVGGTEQPV